MEGVATLYDELGVRPDATADELRHAYRRRARELHPDLRPGEDDRASEAMTRLNSAWRILSDPATRRRYDVELALAGVEGRAARLATERPWERPDGFGHGSGAGSADDVDEPPRRAMRPRVWMIVVAVMAVIFVFTAYAAARPSSPAKGGQVGQCLTSVPSVEVYVPCSQPNVGRLVREVPPDQACPPGTFRHLLVSRNQVACLTRT